MHYCAKRQFFAKTLLHTHSDESNTTTSLSSKQTSWELQEAIIFLLSKFEKCLFVYIPCSSYTSILALRTKPNFIPVTSKAKTTLSRPKTHYPKPGTHRPGQIYIFCELCLRYIQNQSIKDPTMDRFIKKRYCNRI